LENSAAKGKSPVWCIIIIKKVNWIL